MFRQRIRLALVVAALAAAAAIPTVASAATWWIGGTLYGNVCRYGPYYMTFAGGPVGSPCSVMNAYGAWINGQVTNE